MLAAFMQSHRNEIFSLFLEKRRAASSDGESAEVERHIQHFYDEMLLALAQEPRGIREGSPAALALADLRHGLRLDLSSVVHDYGDLCDSITLAAEQHNVTIEIREYRIFSQVVDGAIATAVEHMEQAHDRDAESHLAVRIGFLAHELRNALTAATMSWRVIRDGLVPAAGKTATLVDRSHRRLKRLIDDMLVDARLRAGALRIERFGVRDLLAECEAAVTMFASAKGVGLAVRADTAAEISGDRMLLVSALSNLLQNAIRYTPPEREVKLSAQGNGSILRIEVTDGCGGLEEGAEKRMFGAFAWGKGSQGVGLGLHIAKQAVEAHGGQVCVTNHPGDGCTFTITAPLSAR
jgi:signal transduction histidine kinase